MNEQQQPPSTPALNRVFAFSQQGDIIHQLCLSVLEHLIEHGTEEERARAQATRDNWDGLQDSVIKWGNESGYFNFCQQAMADPKGFKRRIEQIPGDVDTTILLLALEAGMRVSRPKGIGKTRIGGKKKKR